MSNLRALIVDDEILVATLLRSSVDWPQHGVAEPEIATSVDAALTLLSEHTYDIVFTDIHMPVINGLIFAREVTRLYPQIQIIVVTGYDEFEYAKESVKIGVLEYLQKPIHPEEIQSAVIRARDRVLQTRKATRAYAKLRDQLFSNMEYLRERTLNQLVTRDLPQQDLGQLLKQVDIQPVKQFVTVAVIELVQEASVEVTTRLVMNQTVLKLLNEHFECVNERYAFLDGGQRIVLLAFSNHFDFYEYAQLLQSDLASHIPCPIHVGIGNAYAWQDDYEKSYQEATAVLQILQSDPSSAVSESRSLWMNHHANSADYHKELSQLLVLVQAGLDQKVQLYLTKMKQEIEQKQVSTAAVKAFAIRAFSGITSMLLVEADSTDAFVEQHGKLGEIYRAEQPTQAFAIMSDYLLAVTQRIGHQYEQNKNQSIDRIQQYVMQELSSNMLSLSSVAQKFSYNQSYLSRMFKKGIGMTFSEYLMTLRMEHAGKLIAQSDLRAYQVAQQVGFVDSNYFSTCFKKYTGMTVSQYRQEKKSAQ